MSKWTNFIDAVESDVVATAPKVGPWAITIPAAWAIGSAALEHFGWNAAVATMTGAGVEILGVTSSYTLLELYAHNQVRRQDDPARPVWAAVFVTVVYFVCAILLTAVVEGDWLLAIFPVLSLVGSVILGLRIQHRALALRMAGVIEAERQAEIERQAAEAAENARIEAERNAENARLQAEALRLQSELESAKEQRRIEREERKAAKRIAEEAAKVQEELQKAVEEPAHLQNFLQLPQNPTYEQFAEAMALRNGDAPDRKDAVKGLQSLGVKRVAYDWYDKFQASKEREIEY